jgi:hypothetical protein
MKKITKIISCFIVFSIVYGCTAYKAAVDERRVGTIADDTVIKGKILSHVVLYGLVGSKDEINKAIDHAKSVGGTRGVTSLLESVR